MKVAAIQMTSSADQAANLDTAGHWLARAADAGAAVAVLPENFSFMGVRDADKRALAEADGHGAVQDFLARQAQALQLWIVAGTVPLAGADGRVAAASLVYAADGRRVARYDKIHLFDVDLPGRQEQYRESAHVIPGTHPVVVDTPAGRLGLSVCYDLRFPELYRALIGAGAEWITVPSAFTVPTGQAHWESLLRARAIENLCYVVASAQWGEHASGRKTYGDSLIIDYWGAVLVRHSAGTGVITAELDLAALRACRESFPALQHRQILRSES